MFHSRLTLGLVLVLALLAGCTSSRTRAPEADTSMPEAQTGVAAAGAQSSQAPSPVPAMPEAAPAATAEEPVTPVETKEAPKPAAPAKPEPASKAAGEPKVSKPRPTAPVVQKPPRKPVVKANPKAAPRAMPTRKPKPAPAANRVALAGIVQLRGAAGQNVRAEDFGQTVVYFVPDRRRARPQPGTFTIYTHHRDFNPEWLVVPLGSTVTFTNLDTVKHNVFSVSPGNQFNLGYQSSQSSVNHRFDQPGLVLLSCNVHRAMRGDILVVPSRFAGTVRRDGSFRLAGVPNVAGTLYFWSPRARSTSMRVKPPFDKISTRLSLTRPALTVKIGISR